MSFSLEHCGHGNANVIFRYDGDHNAKLRHKVLRLRKEASFDSFDASAQHDFQKLVVNTVLKAVNKNVLSSELVPLSIENFEGLNELLCKHPTRPAKFVSSRINTDAKHGLLLPLLQDSSTHRLLEFKPKWLTQSPNAPRDAMMCRTCALRLSRQASKSHTLDINQRFCPLDLASRDEGRVSRAFHGLNYENNWHLTTTEFLSLTHTFCQHPLVDELTCAQSKYGHELALAMTLRDCSVYIELSRSTAQVANLWIADLDRKSLSKKASWEAMEGTLEKEGWYHGKGLSPHHRPCIRLAKNIEFVN
ncbi:Inositol-pentakisphosphate 2-kinase [Taphrina deformans PYCC 5710]|uniref:Inositol-pentakisphosphate 2-kinase n=1 Tax=Taphrina deformans (strain PYCC 5710 / ATCC 11124 / CBS 356.35 / IMI 108563 / JCM 9778 / NBRC 8474) TaxID=1097556 RepID=R4XI26_TAPDE|nr:Inositol-pentakisphosphate 2-kinase [Taphrina deformans PYCC 5710]|eukprot:CCG83052.1 Inositol-pentakisphosphate 2-kinase [Taphrina deformans PYCC 5710]